MEDPTQLIRQARDATNIDALQAAAHAWAVNSLRPR